MMPLAREIGAINIQEGMFSAAENGHLEIVRHVFGGQGRSPRNHASARDRAPRIMPGLCSEWPGGHLEVIVHQSKDGVPLI